MDGGLDAEELLERRVLFRDIVLGIVVDVILDAPVRRVIGLDVLCGDRARRFLPFGACEIRDGAIGVDSALVLSDELAFYRSRGLVLSALRRKGVPLRPLEV
jgi:hypothetical protein